MPSTLVPRADADLGPWATHLAAGCVTHATALGLTVGETTALTTAAEDWNGAYPAHLAAQSASESARAVKDDARAAFETLARAANAKIQANPAVNADLKTELGLPVHDTTPSRVAVPTTRPLLVVDTSQRLQHKISFRDEATPSQRGKPAGVREIEIWAKIGAPAPIGPSECAFLGTGTKTNLLLTHQDADAGKPVHYIGRWKNTRGETGPWSETVIATIVG